MRDFLINGDFLVSYPVFALLRIPRFSAGGTKITCQGFVTVGKAFALYTDCDLATRYLAACGNSLGFMLAKLGQREALLTMLEEAKSLGFKQVVFDPTQPLTASGRCFGVEEVIKSVQRDG